jgi:molecular chaperone GrpE
MSNASQDNFDENDDFEPGVDDAHEPVEPEASEEADAGAQTDENELIKLRTERDQLFQRLARAQADYQNSRRRLQQEFEGSLAYANQALIKALLPVIDNFERALAVDPSKADARSILKGLQVVYDQWINVLKAQNIEPIAPPEGEPFDPTRHEALMQQPNDKYKEPTVTQLLQKGYALAGRVIRPAQVAVSRVE